MEQDSITHDRLLALIEVEAKNKTRESLKYGITIKDKIIIDSSSHYSSLAIHFENCKFLDKFTMHGNELDDNINFRNCHFSKGLLLIDVKKAKRILISDCRIDDNFIIMGNFDQIITYTTTINKMIVGDGTSINKLEIGGMARSNIKYATILGNNAIKKIQIANCNVEQISFSNLANDTEIFNCSLNSILFNRIRNNGNLKLLNCKAMSVEKKSSHFISNESNLGKAEFFQFNFASFDEVNIINSVLNECLFVNSTWADNIKAFAGDQMDNYIMDREISNAWRLVVSKTQRTKVPYKESQLQLRDKKEVYKQIKYALSKQGDSVNEQMFHILEMNTHNRILNWRPANFSTKIILNLSSISSNFGQSLSRPIIFLLIVNGLLFSLLNYSNGLRFVAFSEVSSQNAIETISQFIWYLNPFHNNNDLRGIPLIVDIFIRIVSSYSIYNIIRATRRFIK